MQRKGIILAAGRGSRLFPATLGCSKILLPVYNKPMIYYPLSILMSAKIRDILIIVSELELPRFKRLLGDGSQWGIKLQFAVQAETRGIADAFLIGEDFLAGDPCALILGDNVFYGNDLSQQLQAIPLDNPATIFAYAVNDPERYGVIELDSEKKALSIEEKPTLPKSRYAIPGLYFFDHQAIEFAKTLSPSARGELEVVDIQKAYLAKNQLRVEILRRGIAWFDSGTPASLLQTSQFIETIEERQGVMIGCPEEIAFKEGYIDEAQLRELASPLQQTPYGHYLAHLADEAVMA
jgi:glucose-1-phosphate thymidylyltransferase